MPARCAEVLLLCVLSAQGASAQSLEISADTTTTLAGVVVDRRQPAEDDGAAVAVTPLGIDGQGGAPVVVYDGSAQGIAAGLDLDAVYRSLDDNHLLVSFGGIGPTSTPDGIGDACQCGDANNDGRVTGLDGTLVKRASLGLVPFTAGVSALPAPNKCDVNGGTTGDPTFHCSGLDGTLIQRASLALPRAVQQACPAADGN